MTRYSFGLGWKLQSYSDLMEAILALGNLQQQINNRFTKHHFVEEPAIGKVVFAAEGPIAVFENESDDVVIEVAPQFIIVSSVTTHTSLGVLTREEADIIEKYATIISKSNSGCPVEAFVNHSTFSPLTGNVPKEISSSILKRWGGLPQLGQLEEIEGAVSSLKWRGKRGLINVQVGTGTTGSSAEDSVKGVIHDVTVRSYEVNIGKEPAVILEWYESGTEIANNIAESIIQT